MNLKSNILKIGVVIALIMMLIPVVAAEDVDNTAYAESVDGTDVISEDVGGTDELAADDDAAADDTEDGADDGTEDETEDETDEDIEVDAEADGSADLQISVITPQNKAQVGDLTSFGIIVFNNGPDTATNVLVRATLVSGNVYILSTVPTQGQAMVYDGVLYWFVGDLAPGEYAYLAVAGLVLSNKDIFILATVTSDTPDPDESNNIAFGFIDVVDAAEEPVSEELPATGNPIAMALLALLSVVGISLRRKF
ncbi:MAG: DUF11 domain-containing protein [Bacilli bacterium]|nr:DUF11 domain-containing protein [Methanobrevibacter sp.]MBQ6687260.1 DUF11 domain-containing protein [Bacilli bacterium]